MKMTPLLGLKHAALPARDLARGLRFYREVLGFETYHATERDWAMVAGFGTSVSLVQSEPGTAAVGSHPPSGMRTGVHPAHLGLTLPDCAAVDEWHERVRTHELAQGLALTPPKRHRDGSYGFYLNDPEGNALEIIFIPLISQAPAVAAPYAGRGLILFAHGSRDAEWQAPFERMLERLRTHLPANAPAALAYLEFCSPTLSEAALAVARAGASQVVVVPMFLAAGGHLRADVPEAIAQARAVLRGAGLTSELSVDATLGLLNSPAFEDACLVEAVRAYRHGLDA